MIHLYLIFTRSSKILKCLCGLGDPSKDLEYEEYYREQRRRDFIIPEPIRNFLTYFQKVVKDQNIYEIQNAYENGYVYG